MGMPSTRKGAIVLNGKETSSAYMVVTRLRDE